jgi:hypothetical protein
MWSELGVSWPDAGLVVVSTASIYLTFVVLVRVVGQRSLAAMASFDLALVVAVGSVIARTALLGILRKRGRLDAIMSGSPLLLAAGHEVVHASLARAHILESELRQEAPPGRSRKPWRRPVRGTGAQPRDQRHQGRRATGRQRHRRRRRLRTGTAGTRPQGRALARQVGRLSHQAAPLAGAMPAAGSHPVCERRGYLRLGSPESMGKIEGRR